MNEKGFTLIEILITITIMALILIMVMPSITALQRNNEKRAYEYYADAMMEAARVYVNKEGEDINSLGIANWVGCVDITYADLINADLLDPYSDEAYDCSEAVVRYTRSNNGEETGYQYNMTCRRVSNNEIVYSNTDFNIGVACSVSEAS